MGMEGKYLRITPAQLARAEVSLKSAEDLLEHERGAEGEQAPETARHLTTHKAWHAIDYLLQRARFPVSIVYGERDFTDDDDWGNGPPRFLPPDRVRAAADGLRLIRWDELCLGVQPRDLGSADVYPDIWDEPDALDWIRHWFEPLVPFFAGAARDGDAMLVWID